MNLLVTDMEYFEKTYSDAVAFLQAGELRMEAFALARNPNRTPWQNDRLKELMENAPACMEPWFVDKIEREIVG